ncbi:MULTISPECIES: hypothetical protein [Cupriavidus]
MTHPFSARFPSEFAALRGLFGSDRIDAALPRLQAIYDYTEAKWQAYAAQLPDGLVRYVLVAEAPPWSEHGVPQFLLDPASRVRTLMRALRKVFPGAADGSTADALAILARHGFLLLDSTPFAMNYAAKRASPRYEALIGLTTRTYLQAKIDALPLTWSPSLRVAFAVKRNAGAIIHGSGGQLVFGGRPHAISMDQVAINGAGYPDATALRDLYRIAPVAAG